MYGQSYWPCGRLRRDPGISAVHAAGAGHGATLLPEHAPVALSTVFAEFCAARSNRRRLHSTLVGMHPHVAHL